RTVGAACMGLAGAGRDAERALLRGWADRCELASAVRVATDAELLLAAGTPEGWGLALVAGTGSIAFARTPDGRTSRGGGWGPLLGDEGSGYAIVLAGLRAAVRAADGRAEKTTMLQSFLARLSLSQPQELIPTVYGKLDRAALAALAPVVFDCAARDDAQ